MSQIDLYCFCYNATDEQKKKFDVFEAQAGQGPKFRMYNGRKMHDAEWLTVKTEEFLDKVPDGKPRSNVKYWY